MCESLAPNICSSLLPSSCADYAAAQELQDPMGPLSHVSRALRVSFAKINERVRAPLPVFFLAS